VREGGAHQFRLVLPSAREGTIGVPAD